MGQQDTLRPFEEHYFSDAERFLLDRAKVFDNFANEYSINDTHCEYPLCSLRIVASEQWFVVPPLNLLRPIVA